MPGLYCVLRYQQREGAVSVPDLAFHVGQLELASRAPGTFGFSGQHGSSACSHPVLLPGLAWGRKGPWQELQRNEYIAISSLQRPSYTQGW